MKKHSEEDDSPFEVEAELIFSFLSECPWLGTVDTRGVVSYAYFSPSVLRLCGIEKEEFVSGEILWENVVHPDHICARTEALARLGRRESLEEEIVYRGVIPIGKRAFFQERLILARGSTVVGIIRDLSTKLKEEEDQARLAAIVETSDDCILSKTLDGTITSWNGGAERLYGYSPEEIIGKHVSVLMPESHKDDFHRFVKKIQNAEQILHFETLRKKKDGTIFHVSVSLSPMRNRFGDLIGISTIARDISREKLLEASLEQAITELKRSNDELDSFASIAAHDLQEPLRTVACFSRLIQKDREEGRTERFDEHLAFVYNSVTRLQTLITDLLEYGRIGKKKDFVQLALGDVLGAVLSELRPQIEERRAEVKVRNLPPNLTADRSGLFCLFQNLISNALKYCSQISPKIEISAEPEGTEWIFSVKDNGIGISPEHFGELFQIFHRLHSREAYPGTGIGLASCKKVVDYHGGRIWVESEPNHGSTFYFTLPKIARTP